MLRGLLLFCSFASFHFSSQVLMLMNTGEFCSEAHDIVAYYTCAVTITQWILEVPSWGFVHVQPNRSYRG